MKKKGIVFCIPGHGHVNPSLAVVKELVDRNHQIDYCCTTEFRQKIELTGARFIPFPFDISYPASENFNLLEVFADVMEFTYKALPILEKMLLDGQYDFMLVDMYTAWGRILAEKLNFPIVLLNPIFSLHKDLKEPSDSKWKLAKSPFKSLKGGWRMNSYYNKIKKKYKVPRGNLISFLTDIRPEVHICFTSKLFQPQAELFPENYVFTGPNINTKVRTQASDFPWEKLEGRKVIYISLGSVIIKKKFIETCIATFANTSYFVVLNISKSYKISDFHAPSNFIICNYVPQLELLPKLSAFITHGGMNSAHEGIYFEVPLVVAPEAGDQFLVAQTVVKNKLGVWIDSDKITATQLLKEVDKVVDNKGIKANLNYISQSFKKAGGYQKAVDIIEQFIASI